MRKILATTFVVALMLSLMLSTTPVAAASGGVDHGVPPGTDEENWKSYPVGMAFLDFEDKSEGDVLGEEIPGVAFTTTMGLDWLVGTWSSGSYNGKYPGGGIYTSEGDKWAWLGVSGDSGIITFTKGTAGYVAVLTSTHSGLVMDAYDEADNLIVSSGWATTNTNTGTMDRLWVESAAKDIKYVILHDTGNYWCIDCLVTDAPGIGEIEVNVDIKPTSWPNPLNVNSKGVLPVAILGTEDFDVTQIDPATILLEGVAPLRWAFEDVATPGDPLAGPDGFMDLSLKFDTQEIVAALGDVNDGDEIILHLMGNLKAEFDGASIVGEDVVRIIEKK
jgi:hypothetical protein